jgi:hypothetical protein
MRIQKKVPDNYNGKEGVFLYNNVENAKSGNEFFKLPLIKDNKLESNFKILVLVRADPNYLE